MKSINKIIAAFAAVVSTISTGTAFAETTAYGTHDSTSGSYVDYMKTVYARAGKPEVMSLPLTSFDKDFELHGLAAENWSQSTDGLTWTFNLRKDLVWSDGEPLKASDYVFAMKRAATSGYDFGWYWDFAGGVKNWKEIVDGTMGIEELGIRATDATTIEVDTKTVKPYLPSVVSLWYPVPEHQWNKFGDEYAANVDTMVTSGPFILESWEKSNNRMVLAKSPTYTGPWPAMVDKLVLDPTLGAPEVGFPAYLAGDVDLTALNAGQIPYAEAKFADQIRKNPIFAVSYISYDMTVAPFDNIDVRKALWYAIDRDEMTSTVLKNLALPGRSLLAPGFPGYNEKIADLAVFDPEKAREYLAAAGYPDGKDFPPIEIWYRDQGGYNGAITGPMLQYLQAEFKEHLNIDMGIKIMSTSDWYDALTNNKNNLFLSPYEYDYLDPSNFFGIFYDGGRHSHKLESYDVLVAEADASSDWDKRLELYEQAEMELINNASIVPLMHPITTSLVKDTLKGEGTTNNKLGFAPLAPALYFYTHIEK
ncbi:MAG: peptide ABC transporter substrate-binding protein [Rhizobiales bacterium]|nr:peptide ABC transporter substrate-binding protein [Hyphomicrobiales bacterium]NRB14347.1 peptide ABC transporter substrate-binding protein [Hyphomicrobiales bacterium]